VKLTILGCGTSSGVPRIGNDWGDCDPTDPRNRRTRASILIESETTRILVDTAPDLREQFLAADIIHLDAVLWTHDHADHCHGIDDLRQVFHHRRTPVSGYARKETLGHLHRRFGYIFDGRDGYPAVIEAGVLEDDMTLGDIRILSVDQPHGTIWSTGFRFEKDGRSISYSTDFHEFTPAMIDLFAGTDVWVVDALRERPHPTHTHLAQTLAAIASVRPGRAILTHMDQSMDYSALRGSLPDGVEPGHDGLIVEFS
jgi:phosphoribosyl 1,2-cyclic phosphate phosphodiesterase